MPPKQPKQQKPTAGGTRKQAQPVTWQSNAKMPELNLSSMVKLPKQAGVRVKISLKPNRGGLRQQPARPVFRSETDLQLDIGIAAVNVTAHNVVIQFDNTGTT